MASPSAWCSIPGRRIRHLQASVERASALDYPPSATVTVTGALSSQALTLATGVRALPAAFKFTLSSKSHQVMSRLVD